MERIKTRPVHIGESLIIGGGNPIAIQTMCNTHTSDVEATVAQCLRLAEAGAQLIRITVPSLSDVDHIKEIRARLRSCGCTVPLCADIHFSSATAIAVAPHVEKVRINPGNFHRDHGRAREEFARLLEVCRANGTAIRVGLNHGSLGSYITDLYGNTPLAMAKAAMEWLDMCVEASFYEVVVSLKASNTVMVVQAYEELVRLMTEKGYDFPLHIGVTEAGGGIEGRAKSCVALSALLSRGIGDTIRVSLTEDPENELPVARYIVDYWIPADERNEQRERCGAGVLSSGPCVFLHGTGDTPRRVGIHSANQPELLQASCEWGPKLLRREIDEIPEEAGLPAEIVDEVMQASRRRFYKPEYIACPGCGRTMYDLQGALEKVKSRTSHLKDTVIAVMGCIVNGPGEMADADWGYVGEGAGKVSIYRKGVAIRTHVPEAEAPDLLAELIENDKDNS